MSNKVSVLVYSRRFGSPVRKAVMVYFAERASDNGAGVWASKATIAQAIECGRSTVIRTIKEFVAEGLLIEVGTRPCRDGETVEYAIDLDAVAALDDASDVPERDRSRSGTSLAAGRDQSRSGTPTSPAAGPKPSLGTIIEPSVDIQARAKPGRKTRMPDNAALSEKMAEIAKAEGISMEEAEAQFGRFKDYATANGKAYANWDAAWRNWLRSPFFKPITKGNGYDNRAHAHGQKPNPAGTGRPTSLAGIVAQRRLDRG